MRIAARSVYVDSLEGDANEIEQMSCGHPTEWLTLLLLAQDNVINEILI